LDWFSELGRRLLVLLRRRQFDRDLDEEMRLHRELREQEQVEAGMTPEEAHYAALRRFGNVALTRERSREMWGWSWLENTVQDVRYGLRQLRRSPAFTAVAVLTLALGIGANTAIFTLINAVLLNTLPVTHPEQLVLLRWESPHVVTDSLPYPIFAQLRDSSYVFDGMFAFCNVGLATDVDGKPGIASGQLGSGSYFSVLGVQAIAGRTFASEEDRVPGGDPVAVISYRYWKRQFGLDPAAVGRSITLNGLPFSIIGVASPGFDGVSLGDAQDIWIPMMMQEQVMNGRMLLKDPKGWFSRSWLAANPA
jgi:hypothetical protein